MYFVITATQPFNEKYTIENLIVSKDATTVIVPTLEKAQKSVEIMNNVFIAMGYEHDITKSDSNNSYNRYLHPLRKREAFICFKEIGMG